MHRSLRVALAMVFVFALCMPLFIPRDMAHAISMSPPTIDATKVLQGVSQKATVYIGRLPAEVGELEITVSARGDYAGMLQFEPLFIIPADVETYAYEFTMNSGDAAEGTYQVPMNFALTRMENPAAEAVEATSGGTSMSVITGATIMVNITVSNEKVLSYSLEDVSVAPLESDDAPALTIGVVNTGNVEWIPSGFTVTFTSLADPTSVKEHAVATDGVAAVPVGERTQLLVEVPTTLAEGAYTVTVKANDAGGVVTETTSLSFTVMPPDTLQLGATLAEVAVSESLVETGTTIALQGNLKNTGQMLLKGKLTVEVYRDGEYVDVVVGEEVKTLPGESAEVSVPVKLGGAGAYTLKSFIAYSGLKSNIVESPVTVEGSALAEVFNSPYMLAAIVLAILAATGIIAYRRHAHSRGTGGGSTPSAPAAPRPQPPVSAPPAEPRAQQASAQPAAPSTPAAGSAPRRRW